MKTGLTIIILTYNDTAVARKLISRILGWGDTVVSLLCIDDGSDPHESQALKNFATNKEIKLIRNHQNLGILKTRMRALEEVDTEWFCFVDADDDVDRTYYPRLKDIGDQNNSDCVISGASIVDEVGKFKGLKAAFFWNQSYFSPDILSAFSLKKIGPNVVWNKIYRRSVWNAPKIDTVSKINSNEDVLFNLFFLREARKITTTPGLGYFYKQNDKSFTSQSMVQKLPSIFESYRCMVGILTKQELEIVKPILVDQYQRLLSHVSHQYLLESTNSYSEGEARSIRDLLAALRVLSKKNPISKALSKWRLQRFLKGLFVIYIKLRFTNRLRPEEKW